MRTDGRRKKKLIVAFHFQFASQTGWKCGTCRKQGLEIKRRCGWVDAATLGEPRPVWGRRQVRLTQCPKSTITAQSEEWLESYQVGRVFGFGDVALLPARTVDAFCVLEKELAAERNHDDN